MSGKILLEDIEIYAYHGVLPEENKIGTTYIINIEVETDLWKAAESDDLNDTISYADINEIIHQEMAIPSQLLEHVANRIIKRIENEFKTINKVKIKITKKNPPMRGLMYGASIVLEKIIK